MRTRMKTCLTLSLVAHLGILAWARSVPGPTFIESGRMPATGGVVMAELVAPPEAAAAPPRLETSPESSPPDREEPAVPPGAEIAPAATSASATDNAPTGNGVPGKRLNMDFARLAWVQKVVVNTLNYQRNAPKGFEQMVRAALARHPGIAGGTARISFRNDPSGTVGVVILSDSPELKTALSRVGWETGPLPARYQIPCSGLNVNITVTGPNLSVGVEIL